MTIFVYFWGKIFKYLYKNYVFITATRLAWLRVSTKFVKIDDGRWFQASRQNRYLLQNIQKTIVLRKLDFRDGNGRSMFPLEIETLFFC